MNIGHWYRCTSDAASSRGRRRRRRLGLLAIVSVVPLAPATSADAALIEHRFGGVITAADPSNGVAPGTRFSGTFAYDPATKPGGIMFEGYHSYDFNYPLSGAPAASPSLLTLEVGGVPVYDRQGLQVNLTNEIAFHSDMSRTEVRGTSDQLLVQLALVNPTNSVNSSLELPLALSLGDFPEAKLLVVNRASGKGEHLFEGTIDTLTLVPEPGVLSLVGLAGIGLAARRIRRRPWRVTGAQASGDRTSTSEK